MPAPLLGPRARLAAALALAAASVAPRAAGADPDWAARRAAMIRQVEADVVATAAETGRAQLAPRVAAALAGVPRHEFVPAPDRRSAYENRPLPIGFGQTISQPYIVALMTDLLEVEPGDAVLEVGTGSGYQAAILAALGARVATIEIIPELAATARQRLAHLGYGGAEVRQGDGYEGWGERSPFDGILVAAAASHIPPPLLAQLAPGGRMVIPVGGPFAVQQLLLVTKDEDGHLRTRQILPVAFVPLVRGR